MYERLKAVRKAVKLNQTEFAARIGLTQNYWTMVENGKRDPSNQVILSICREYGVDEIWLRTGEGEMFQPKSKEEEIAAFVGKLLRRGNDGFKRRFVAALAELPEEAWEAVEEFTKKVAAESGHPPD